MRRLRILVDWSRGKLPVLVASAVVPVASCSDDDEHSKTTSQPDKAGSQATRHRIRAERPVWEAWALSEATAALAVQSTLTRASVEPERPAPTPTPWSCPTGSRGGAGSNLRDQHGTGL
jgi:hypothetical protein